MSTLEKRVHVLQTSCFFCQRILFSLRLLLGLLNLTQSVYGCIVDVLHFVDCDDGEDRLVQAEGVWLITREHVELNGLVSFKLERVRSSDLVWRSDLGDHFTHRCQSID